MVSAVKVKCNGGQSRLGQGSYLCKDMENYGLRAVWLGETECQKDLGLRD